MRRSIAVIALSFWLALLTAVGAQALPVGSADSSTPGTAVTTSVGRYHTFRVGMYKPALTLTQYRYKVVNGHHVVTAVRVSYGPAVKSLGLRLEVISTVNGATAVWQRTAMKPGKWYKLKGFMCADECPVMTELTAHTTSRFLNRRQADWIQGV